MPSCAQRLTVFGDTWRSSATCAVRRYLGSVVWSNALSRSCCRSPVWGRPYARRGRMVSSVLRRLAVLRCIPCGLAPGRCHGWTLTSLPLLVPDLELRSPPTAVAPAQATGRHSHRPAARHARTPGCDKQWPSPLLCARQRFTFCLEPAGRACPLPSAPASGRRRAIPPRSWREGQGHDGWNREMVQRRQGLRLHRP
jgi:hypothetical protein